MQAQTPQARRIDLVSYWERVAYALSVGNSSSQGTSRQESPVTSGDSDVAIQIERQDICPGTHVLSKLGDACLGQALPCSSTSPSRGAKLMQTQRIDRSSLALARQGQSLFRCLSHPNGRHPDHSSSMRPTMMNPLLFSAHPSIHFTLSYHF